MSTDEESRAGGVHLRLWRGPAGASIGEEPGGQGRYSRYDDADDPACRIVCCQQPTGAPLSTDTGSETCQAFSGPVVSDRGDAGTAGSYLLVVGFAVPAAAVGRFDDWYETEHSPLLLEAEGWLRVRRLEVDAAIGVDWTHVAIHDLAALTALDSPERDAARNGPKRQQFLGEEWYQRSSRWMGRRPGTPA